MARAADDEYTPKQHRVALDLAAGRSVRQAAQTSGVSRTTVFDWLKDSGFKLLVTKLRGRILDRAVGQFTRDALKARATLRKLLDDDSATVRLRAAEVMLTAGMKLRDHAELDARLLALEEAQAEGAIR